MEDFHEISLESLYAGGGGEANSVVAAAFALNKNFNHLDSRKRTSSYSISAIVSSPLIIQKLHNTVSWLIVS